MQSFKNLKISAKLLLGFFAVLALTACLGIVSIMKLATVNENVTQLGDNWGVAIYALGEINAGISDVRRLETTYAGDTDEARAADEKELRQVQDTVKKYMDMYEPTLTLDLEKRLYPEYKDYYQRFLSTNDQVLSLIKAHREKEALQLTNGDAKTFFYKANDDINVIDDANFKALQDEAKNAHTTYASARLTTVAVLVAATVVGLILAFWIASMISKPLRAAAEKMRDAEQERNLTVHLEADSTDEVGQICNSFNGFVKTLHDVIAQLSSTAEHVASASEEISSSAEQQSQGAATQKDQTTQVATAMQEMSSTVLQVSENSGKASEASRKAAETARHGGDIVDQTLAKMQVIAQSVRGTAAKVEELGKSSDQIGRIIGVINDIADQTNLLALNAAIEAARAGEQGRGFAVVADEVRKLAERTTASTKEIAQMIETVQKETKLAVGAMEEGTKQVEEGVQTTSKAGEALKEIIQMSEQVGDMVTHIATAATEQSSATEQINGNMDQIANLVKESAQGAEQSAKACQELSGLAFELQKMVSNFKLGDDAKATAAGRFSTGSAHGAASKKPEKAMAAAAR